jgi:hypothetical protein
MPGDNTNAPRGTNSGVDSSEPNLNDQDRLTIVNQEGAPPIGDDTLASSAYVGAYRLNPRFVTTTAITARPLVSVPINMEAIREAVRTLYVSSYLYWPQLRSLYSGDQISINDAILIGCSHLASATCLMIYNLLRYKCGVYDSQNQQLYRTRCHLDMGMELPKGVAFIVEHFGYAQASQAYGNPTFIHRWDGANNVNQQFGLQAAHSVNTHLLNGFLAQLFRVGVPFRRIDKYCMPRNLWDSLYIRVVEGGYDVFTTYPIENYDLPRDVFLAIGICDFSTLDANAPVQFYPPRMDLVDSDAITTLLKADLPVNASNLEQRAMPALTAGKDANDTELRVCGPVPNVHLTGVMRDSGLTDLTNKTVTYKYTANVYGRGGARQAMRIDCVARGVTPEEVNGFFRALLRKE